MKPMRAGHVLEVLATLPEYRNNPGQLPDVNTLRQWHRRGLLPSHGRDKTGRHLFDPAEVADFLTQRARHPA